jgi:hypothetical protein
MRRVLPAYVEMHDMLSGAQRNRRFVAIIGLDADAQARSAAAVCNRFAMIS